MSHSGVPAKSQISWGGNQIQKVVIARSLLR